MTFFWISQKKLACVWWVVVLGQDFYIGQNKILCFYLLALDLYETSQSKNLPCYYLEYP